MKNKEHVKIILIILLVITLITLGTILFVRNEELKEVESNLERTLDNYETSKTDYKLLEETFEEYKTNNNENEDVFIPKECTFTKTFEVIEIFDEPSQIGEKHLIIYQFQDTLLNTVVLEVGTSFYVEKDKTYEFTFKGTTSEHKKNISEYEITNIEITNKTGMDQIQESCN